MPTFSPYKDPEYRAARAALKANPDTPCWHGCGRRATTVDHVPALAEHQHLRGARCCQLRPACARCNYGHGGQIGRERRWPSLAVADWFG